MHTLINTFGIELMHVHNINKLFQGEFVVSYEAEGLDLDLDLDLELEPQITE